EEVFGAHRPDDLRLRVVEGSAAGALIELSHRAQMLVVNRVVVGVSPTRGGAAALGFAFAEAARRGAELVAVRSWAGRDFNLAAATAMSASSSEIWQEQGRAELDASLRPLRTAFPDVAVVTVLSGTPAEVLLEKESADAAMLVLGCRRSQKSHLTRLGPVTTWAARHFDGAVVVVGQTEPRVATTPQEEEMSEETDSTTSSGRIVVGIDGSDGSKNALRWAARIAAATGAGIDAVTVWEYVGSYGWGSFPPMPIPHPELEKSLDEIVEEVFGAHRPDDLRLRVVEGSAAGALIELSHRAQMLVVGSRGHGNVTGLLIGAVSARVAERAACPVLVVHGDSEPPAASS
ncbi:MAG: universal stress protein, partial [Actinobacteria bacterium]|nr:universal stress protein [Actinomycetota bacterium]